MNVKLKPECFVICTTVMRRVNYVSEIIKTGKNSTPVLTHKLTEALAFINEHDANKRIRNFSNPHFHKFNIVKVDLPEKTFGNMKEDISLNEFRKRNANKLI